MAQYPKVISQLIGELGKLPGIGHKTAQRLAFHLLAQGEAEAKKLAEAILTASQSIRLCSECCNLTDVDPCDICANPNRDKSLLCVVENPRDVAAMERIHEYKGLYHILHGAISPLHNIGPEQIKLRALITRLQTHPEIQEIILATNPTVEGEATALYIAKLLKPANIKTTRIARGLSMGGDLEYADEMTLARALEGRQEI